MEDLPKNNCKCADIWEGAFLQAKTRDLTPHSFELLSPEARAFDRGFASGVFTNKTSSPVGIENPYLYSIRSGRIPAGDHPHDRTKDVRSYREKAQDILENPALYRFDRTRDPYPELRAVGLILQGILDELGKKKE